MEQSVEFLVERWEDQRTIKNLMGKYVNCLLLNRQGEIFSRFWSQRPDVCLTFNDGSYVGGEAVRGYFDAVVERNKLSAKLLQARLPEKLGGKSEEEIYGVGPFHVKPLTAPVIEVAVDGETAKGLWFCLGCDAEVTGAGPVANWTWGYFAGDFVYEDDDWKLWHLQYLNDVDSVCGQSWGRPVTPYPDLPEFAALKDFQLPPYTVSATVRELYTPKRAKTETPRIPEPYNTFSETFSYGTEAV
jgi:hypothetical protein